MYTTKIGNVVFNHNSDMSGDVIIRTNADNAEGEQSVMIPYDTLLNFVLKSTLDQVENIISSAASDLCDKDITENKFLSAKSRIEKATEVAQAVRTIKKVHHGDRIHVSYEVH